MKRNIILGVILLAASILYAGPHQHIAVEHINRLAGNLQSSGKPIVVSNDDRVVTKTSFRTPIEITIVAMAESNLRMSYAADLVIFNWDRLPTQFRIDGGPASGQHKNGVGRIPVNKFVTIRWVVLPDKQKIYVDDDLRYEHHGDYTKIDKPVAVFTRNSKVTVKSIKVRDLSGDQVAETAVK
jgi:hypothetical protein